MKRFIFLSLFCLLALLASGPRGASAQVLAEIGPRGGAALGQTARSAGLNFRVDDISLPFIYDLSLVYFLDVEPREAQTLQWQFDVNSLAPFFARNKWFTPYLGWGFAFQYASVETPTDTDERNFDLSWGLNGLGGAILNPSGQFRPFVQARYTWADPSYFGITGGLQIVINPRARVSR